MKNSNSIAISNARKLADITTLLAAAKNADEAREIFRGRYPSESEQALTPPEGEANEPQFWLNFIETAKKLEANCLHLDFDAQYILAHAPTADGREILYEGRLRDGSDGVIFVPHALDVHDDPELADAVENDGLACVGCDPDEGFVDAHRAGHDPDDMMVEYVELEDDNGDPIGWGLDSRVDLGLSEERAAAVAAILRQIDAEFLGWNGAPIRSDLLLCAIRDRDYSWGAVLPIDEAIRKFKTEELEDCFALATPIDDEKVLVLSDHYFAAWLLNNIEAD